jgi:hypothetical protein
LFTVVLESCQNNFSFMVSLKRANNTGGWEIV